MVAATLLKPLARPDLIGASDVAAILGIDPWKSAGDVYARIVHGSSEPVGEEAYWGLASEPMIAARFELDHGVRLEAREPVYGPKGRAWQRVSLDRVTPAPDAVDVEIKTCSRDRAAGLGEPGSDEILDEHFVQVQAQLEALDLPIAYVPYLVGGQRYAEYVVRPDAELQRVIVEACEWFWHDHVLARRPPASVDPATVARIYPRALRAHRQATDRDLEIVGNFVRARDARKAAEASESLVKAALLERLGEHKGLVGDGLRVTWSECKRLGGVHWQGVADELARAHGVSLEALRQISAKHPGKTTEYRSLRVSLRGAKNEAEETSE